MVLKLHGYRFLFTAEHGENTLGIGLKVYFLKCSLSIARLWENLHIFHSVNAICAHFPCMPVICKQIVVAVVYEQLIGADYIKLTMMFFHQRINIINSVYHVFETDFLRLVGFAIKLLCHCMVDGADYVECTFLCGFNSINQENFLLQGFGLIRTAKFAYGFHQFFCF